MNTKDLLADIQDCCDYRDQFAHGIWMRVTDGGLALRRTRGDYETPDGKADRSFVPEACLIPDGYYEQAREIILRTTKAVMDLKAEIKGTFRGLPEEA
jgi:hypothetical protein